MPSILWIDDEPYYLEAHKTALEEAGYKVEIAENEKKALARLERRPLPALIILDIILPKDTDDPGPDNGMSTGIHLLKQISSQIKKQIPIIVLTIVANGGAHDELVEIGRGCKKLEVYVKPFLPSELLEEVNRLLE
jgi:CheY-like chemotaxis protein